MNAIPTTEPSGEEKPLFYQTKIMPIEETMRLLAEQRRPRTGTEAVVFSCSGQCWKCFHQGCKDLKD